MGNRVFYIRNETKAKKDKYVQMYTPYGDYYAMRFPDSTLVMLNAHSSIRFPENFNQDTIRLELKGEGYFEVKPERSASRLYVIVKADSSAPTLSSKHHLLGSYDYEFKVWQSRFNIKAYGDEPYVTTTMVAGEGMNHFTDSQINSWDTIRTGDLAQIIDRGVLITGPADTALETAWKKGRLHFQQTGIRIIMNEVTRWYKMGVTYHDSIPDQLFDLDVSRKATIYEVFKSLAQQGIICRIEHERIHIWQRGI